MLAQVVRSASARSQPLRCNLGQIDRVVVENFWPERACAIDFCMAAQDETG